MTAESHLPIPKPDNGSHIRRRIEQVAMFVQDPSAPEMLASGTLHPLRALALRAVLATPGFPDLLSERVLVPAYRKAGFNILGVGYNAVAVTDGDETVRKYYRNTAGMSEASQKETVKIWLARQDLIMKHLSAYAVPQVFSIEQSPLNPQESIVTATQERINASGSVNMFKSEEIPESATPFIRDSQKMYQYSDPLAVPDLIGRDNALIEVGTGAIKLIDPIALVLEDPNDKGNYLKIARFLDDFTIKSPR